MKDYGHEETEKLLKDLEKRINAEYRTAEREVQATLDDYLRRFQIKDDLKRQAVANGQITQQEYEQWRVGQMAMGKRWKAVRDVMAQEYTNANMKAKSIAYGYMPEVYAVNNAYGAYQVDQVADVDTGYVLYDRDAFQSLFDDSRTLYHRAGKKITARIKEGKDLAWNKKQIQSVMIQGLLQGESISKLSTRLAKKVGESNRKAAIRNARTMATGVQNAGRIDSYKRAESMGIDLMKEWVATLDGRTRHEHRILDGQRVPVDDEFEVDGMKIAFPADPTADARLVYNCRCTLVPALKGFEVDPSDLSLRNTNHMEEETYEEWKEGHSRQSDSITKQDDTAETMRRTYGSEYEKIQNTRMMSSNTKSTWPPKGTPISKEQLNDLKAYGKQFNIEINNFAEFDGNPADIKRAVDSIVKVSKDFPEILKGKHAVQLQLDHHMRDGDFAESYKSVIHLNANAFRNMDVLRSEYAKKVAEGWFVEGTTADSIIYHELGHVVQSYYDLNDIEIAKDVFGVNSRVAAVEKANELLSEYAGSNSNGQEIISEFFSSYYSSTVINKNALNYVKKCINILSKERG